MLITPTGQAWGRFLLHICLFHFHSEKKLSTFCVLIDSEEYGCCLTSFLCAKIKENIRLCAFYIWEIALLYPYMWGCPFLIIDDDSGDLNKFSTFRISYPQFLALYPQGGRFLYIEGPVLLKTIVHIWARYGGVKRHGRVPTGREFHRLNR